MGIKNERINNCCNLPICKLLLLCKSQHPFSCYGVMQLPVWLVLPRNVLHHWVFWVTVRQLLHHCSEDIPDAIAWRPLTKTGEVHLSLHMGVGGNSTWNKVYHTPPSPCGTYDVGTTRVIVLYLCIDVAVVYPCEEHQLRRDKRVVSTEEHVHEEGASFINSSTWAFNNSKPLKQTLPFVLYTEQGEHIIWYTTCSTYMFIMYSV